MITTNYKRRTAKKLNTSKRRNVDYSWHLYNYVANNLYWALDSIKSKFNEANKVENCSKVHWGVREPEQIKEYIKLNMHIYIVALKGSMESLLLLLYLSSLERAGKGTKAIHPCLFLEYPVFKKHKGRLQALFSSNFYLFRNHKGRSQVLLSSIKNPIWVKFQLTNKQCFAVVK